MPTEPTTPTGKRQHQWHEYTVEECGACAVNAAIEREAAEGAGWAEMVGVARSERMKADAIAAQLAEALRGIIRDHALPRPIDWQPAADALTAYEEARK
jgi:hypothetical protein